jgi:N-acetylglutamate synthase-like GNAT family acetyltransferase
MATASKGEPVEFLPLSYGLVNPVKALIADAVLEFYGDLEFLPKTRTELLAYYAKIVYLKDLDDHEAVYSEGNGVFLVARDHDEVIGCGGLRRLGSDAGELVRLWLRKDMRKQGLGRRLFDGLIRSAKGIGYPKIYLDTSHRCEDAVRLFKRNGFTECAKYKESIGDTYLCLDLSP